MPNEPALAMDDDLALVDLLDRLIGGGVVVTGDLVLSMAGVDLVYLGLRLVLAPAHEVGPVLAGGTARPMILLHAVTRALDQEIDLDGWQVRTSGPVSVLFSESGPAARSTEAVLAHGRRITALAGQLALLPMRYGTALDSPDHLAALLAERQEEWSRRLDVVEGHRQLLLHLEARGPTPDTPTVRATPPARPITGREYLRRRADALHEHDRIWGAVVAAVRPHAREHRALPDGQRIAVLVRPEREALVRTAAAEVAGREGRRVAVTGPWPPFSFCEEPPRDR